MSGWTTKKLGEVCEEIRERISSAEIPLAAYITTDNMLKNCAGVCEAENLPPKICSLVAYQSGDILLSNIRPYLKKIWLADRSGGASSDVIVLRPRFENILARYIYRALAREEFFDFSMLNVTGTKMPRGKRDWIKSFEIPIPPLAEQKRIVTKIDAAFEKIDRLKANAEKNLANAKELSQSALDEACKTPKGDKVRLRDVCDVLAGYPFKGNSFSETGIKICGGLIITPTEIKWSECKHWDSSEGLEDYLLAVDDIVIALDRPWIADGFKIGMIEEGDLPCLLIQRTARLRAKKVIPKYLLYVLRHPAFKEYCTFTGATVPHISHKDIERYMIPCPPLTEQKQIIKHLDFLLEKIKMLEQNYERQIADCAEMRQAILREAFEGRL